MDHQTATSDLRSVSSMVTNQQSRLVTCCSCDSSFSAQLSQIRLLFQVYLPKHVYMYSEMSISGSINVNTYSGMSMYSECGKQQEEETAHKKMAVQQEHSAH